MYWLPTHNRPVRVRATVAVTLLLILGGGLMLTPALRGQSSRAKPVSTKSLDVRANRTVDNFAREAMTLARDYEKAGNYEKAQQMLQAVLSLRPEAKALEAEIERLDEKILSSNEFEIDLPAAATWGKPIARGAKDKPFRIVVRGDYQFSADLKISPSGFPTRDPLKGDMVQNIPCGKVIGLFLPVDKKKAAKAKPFAVGVGVEYRPESDGVLFLRVNAPAGSKCSGELNVTMSGYVIEAK